MVHAPDAASPSEGVLAASGTEFAIRLKGWRSQLRWAMTQREEDPARVWLEVISIDERSKRALETAVDAEQRAELEKFRRRLEESVSSLTEELGDEKVAPLYSWLDLVRQRRRLVANIGEARTAVGQARAFRASEGPKLPKGEEQSAAQLAQAQGELLQWQTATPPDPPPEVVAAWEAQGGDALIERLPREAMVVGRRGDEARRVLARAKGRIPGQHPWRGSPAELIAIPLAGAMTLLLASFAVLHDSTGSGGLAGLAGLSFGVFAALLVYSFFARHEERAELAAAIDWVWHARMYRERTNYAELEAGWLRALVEAQRALKSFDAKEATGGQLREFETERPDLAEIVVEVARDTEPLSPVSFDSPLPLSLQIATIATLLAAVFGIAFGTLLAQNHFRGRNLADALVTAPMVLPPTVLGYYLLVALGRHSPLGQLFEALTGSSIVFTRTGAVVAAAIGAFPIMVKSSRAALEDVDPVFVRAARTLGAGPVRAFFTVQLPLAARGILAAVMLSFARSLGDFGVTLMVAGDIPHETQTASLAIYDAIQSHRENEATETVLVLSVIAIGILYLVNRLTTRQEAR